MTDEPFTYTDAEGNEWMLIGAEPGGTLAQAAVNLEEIRAALTPRGFALVRVVGTEPTDEALEVIDFDAGIEHRGTLTLQAKSCRRALFLAGSASREPEVERLRAERDEHTRQRNSWQSVVDKAEERATTAEAELARVRAELIETDKALKECQDWHLDACNQRDEARAKLAECDAELARVSDRIQTLADEAFGPFPTGSVEENLTRIERGAFLERQRCESAMLGCEIAYKREPTREEGDAHESPGPYLGECFVAMGSWTGRRCRVCKQWAWGGPTACVRCVEREARDEARAKLAELHEYVCDCKSKDHVKLAECERERDESRGIVEHLRKAGYELEERFSALKTERDQLGKLLSIYRQRLEVLEEASDLESARTDDLRSQLEASRYRNKQLRRIARDFAADRSRAYAALESHRDVLDAVQNWADHTAAGKTWAERLNAQGLLLNALHKALSASEPTGKAKADILESHDPSDARLEEAGLRWVRRRGAWELEWCAVATVWPNGTWHTWDANGTGGENSYELGVQEAKKRVEESLLRQDEHPTKGWASHGFHEIESGEADGDEEPKPETAEAGPSGAWSLDGSGYPPKDKMHRVADGSGFIVAHVPFAKDAEHIVAAVNAQRAKPVAQGVDSVFLCERLETVARLLKNNKDLYSGSEDEQRRSFANLLGAIEDVARRALLAEPEAQGGAK